MRWLRLGGFAVTLLLLVAITLPIGASYLFVDRLLNHSCVNPDMTIPEHLPQARVDDITIQSVDDISLDGWFVEGERDALVIVLPGARGSRDTMHQEIVFLHEAGFHVMSYNTRNCENLPATLGYAETDDLAAALDWVTVNKRIAEIGVLGFSQGGATVLMHAAIDERIQATIAIGNYSSLAQEIRGTSDHNIFERWSRFWVEVWYEQRTGLDVEQVSPVAHIGAIAPRPVFLIYGSEDPDANIEEILFNAANEPRAVWVVEGAGHGEYIAFAPQEYPQRVIDFFEEYLLMEGAS